MNTPSEGPVRKSLPPDGPASSARRPLDVGPAIPLAPPLYTASVYRCATVDQAEALLAGEEPGYVYSREGHPNAALLAEECCRLHAAERAVIAASGMSALATALLALCRAGDEVAASTMLYGCSQSLLEQESARLGIGCRLFDPCDATSVAAALGPRIRLVVVETISNPMLRVAPLAEVASAAHARGAALLVDNTFAGPYVCRPLEQGADLVLESLTKQMSGHSDVLLGLLAGRSAHWERIEGVLRTWGLAAAPFDCWLAQRGLATLELRAARAGDNALAAAQFLAADPRVLAVEYPGLPSHADHALARRQFGARYGAVVTFTLAGGRVAVEAFVAAAPEIPFCPSLGDVRTTLSHPESTSHRGLSESARLGLGIRPGTIRLSLGIEPAAAILAALERGLAAAVKATREPASDRA